MLRGAISLKAQVKWAYFLIATCCSEIIFEVVSKQFNQTSDSASVMAIDSLRASLNFTISRVTSSRLSEGIIRHNIALDFFPNLTEAAKWALQAVLEEFWMKLNLSCWICPVEFGELCTWSYRTADCWLPLAKRFELILLSLA